GHFGKRLAGFGDIGALIRHFRKFHDFSSQSYPYGQIILRALTKVNCGKAAIGGFPEKISCTASENVL
ncbi:MAG: hypothetical protein IKC99_02615, partial [Clostridia bacterium]|nr:hypothetical protein [Clostridia bacterium]